jgi:putative ABC transport system permease protein
MTDFRYGFRILARNPAFTLVAVVALALGIGANTAIFSLVDTLLLRPLPYQDPERVVMVWEQNKPRNLKSNVISPGNFLDWKAQNQVFEKMAGLMFFSRTNLTGAGEPEELQNHLVTSDFFPLLGVNPLLGRTIQPADDKPGAPAVCVLSHRLWQRRFGGDRSIVGKPVTLNGNPVTVAGVMPPGFYFLKREGELWMPLQLNPARDYRKTSGRYMAAVARLKPGVSLTSAQSNMDGIAARLEREFPEFDTGWGVNVVPMREELFGSVRLPLLVLAAAVGFVLLIACANVANLLLTRAAARQREVAVRASLGASRWRIARQLLSESLLLALAGGAAGVLVAYWGLDLLLALSPKDLPGVDAARIDGRVLLFALLLSVATAAIFGLAAALATSRGDLTRALKEGGGAGVSTRGRLLRDVFVVTEVALALVLLSGAGLLIRSFVRLQNVDPGLNPRNVLTMRVQLPGSKYRDDAARSAFFAEAVRRTEALPGVRQVSAVSFLPFRGMAAGTGFRVAGRRISADARAEPSAV